MAQGIILVPVHQFLLVLIPLLCQVLHQPHFIHMFKVRNPVTSQSLIRYRLQLVCQFWFHIFKLVTLQPMFQVFNQKVDQVIVLPVFQSITLDSTLVYYSHKPNMSLTVSISVPSTVGMHQPPCAHESI